MKTPSLFMFFMSVFMACILLFFAAILFFTDYFSEIDATYISIHEPKRSILATIFLVYACYRFFRARMIYVNYAREKKQAE